MYEEVEINTPLELARYLVNEGDLYIGEDKMRIGVDENCHNGSPFSIFRSDGSIGALMRHTWDVEDLTYYKKLNWYDCIPEGKKVPCYVSDVGPASAGAERSVCAYVAGDEHPYKGKNGNWKYATPVPAYELWVPEL